MRPPGRLSTRSRKAALASLTLAIGVGSALLLAEIALRLIGFEFTLYPTKVQFGWPDPVTIEQRYQLDRDLLWVPKGYHATVESWAGRGPTVAHLGDSCTEFGRYDEFLESIVARNGGDGQVGYSFVNLGVGGWSSYQGLAQMRRDVVRIQPAIATIYFGWNDHWRSYDAQDRDVGEFIQERPAWLLALSRVRLVQLFTRVLFFQRRSAAESRSQLPERVSLADFESNLTEIVRIARENGIVPVLMTAPTSHQVGQEPAYLVPRWLHDLDRLVPLHREYVDVVRAVSRAHNVYLIDLYAEFAKMPADEQNGFFNRDGIHLTEQGNKRIAEIMYDHFVRYGLLHLPARATPASSARVHTPGPLSIHRPAAGERDA